MGKSIHGMRARSRDRARAHHNGRVSSRLFLAGCSPAEPASASPADATLRLHPPQCQRNFIERYFVTVLVVSAQGSTAKTAVYLVCFHSQEPATLDGCDEQFLTVERAIQNHEWPYDNGDDPSFYVARRGGPLTWGVCRQDLRNSIAKGSIVVFFSYTPLTKDEVLYRLCAVETVADKLDHRAVYVDRRFSRFRGIYINTLITRRIDGWRYD